MSQTDLPQIFEYNGKSIRTLIRNGEPWFVAKDVEDLHGIPSRASIYAGYVYAVEYGDCIKIGSTTNPFKRLGTLVSQSRIYASVQVGTLLISKPHTNFVANERVLQTHWKSLRVRGELFRLSIEHFLSDMPPLQFLDETQRLQKKTDETVTILKALTLSAARR